MNTNIKRIELVEPKTFGENLRALRKKRGVLQKQLADCLGVSPSTIGMYEQDQRQPDIETLMKIADFFDCSIDSLLLRPTKIPDYSRKLLKASNALYSTLNELALIQNRLEEAQSILFSLGYKTMMEG